MIKTSRLLVCRRIQSVGSLQHPQEMSKLTSDEVADMRISYTLSSLDDKSIASKDPIKLFNIWFQEAVNHPGIVEPNAMNLATASKEGIPSARIVLLKGVSQEGFKFFTNYESEKGKQLSENPFASITFYWEPLQRQIRINGIVERLSDEESTKYFHKRPIENQIGAICSRQTTVIPDRQFMEEKREMLKNMYSNKVIPKPDYWGGFILKPSRIGFWCGGSGRLHDRIRFRRRRENEVIDSNLTKHGENGWFYERLSP